MDVNIIQNKLTSLKRSVNNYLYGQWTVRDNSTKKDIIEFDTILSYTFESSSDLPSYPLQNGSFSNYNKIINPDRAKIKMAVSGNKTFISKQLKTLESYNNSILLVDLIIPFRDFIGYNLCNLSHGISEGEATSMLIVEFELIEIRQVNVYFKQTQPNNKSTEQTGKANPQEVKNQSLLNGSWNKVKKIFG